MNTPLLQPELLENLQQSCLAMQQACDSRQFDVFVQYQLVHEQLLGQLVAYLSSHGTPEPGSNEFILLQSLVSGRESVQRALAFWSDEIKSELLSLSQNSRLQKTYSP